MTTPTPRTITIGALIMTCTIGFFAIFYSTTGFTKAFPISIKKSLSKPKIDPIPTPPNQVTPPTPPPVENLVNETIQQNKDSIPSWFLTNELQQVTPSLEATKTTANLTAICTGADATNFTCYKQHFQSLLDKGGVKAAFDDVKARYPVNDYVRAECHPIAHIIGQQAVKYYPTVAEAYKHGDSYCWSGYYHGVLEGIIGKIGYNKISSSIDSICSDIAKPKKYSFDHYNCVHGLGHGVMAITNDELFKSLQLCDNIKDSWERESCWSGVFMENIIIDNKNHFTKFLKPEEPLYPCSAVEEKYKKTCYLMQTSYMLKISKDDSSKVFELCQKAEKAHQATCYQSLGRDASGRSTSDIGKTNATCNLGKDFTQRSNCIIGAVKDFISCHHSYDQANNLCKALDPELVETCNKTVKEYKIL